MCTHQNHLNDFNERKTNCVSTLCRQLWHAQKTNNEPNGYKLNDSSSSNINDIYRQREEWAKGPNSNEIEANSNCAKWKSVKLKMMQESFKLRCRQVIFQVPSKCDSTTEKACESCVCVCVRHTNIFQFIFILDEIVHKQNMERNPQMLPKLSNVCTEDYDLPRLAEDFFTQTHTNITSKRFNNECALDAHYQPPSNYIHVGKLRNIAMKKKRYINK